MRTQQVECILFRRVESVEFLLLKRIPAKGGFWQPPCGGVEAQESLLEAAYREVAEETGIQRDRVVAVLPDVHTFTMSSHYLTGELMPPITEHVFGFEVDKEVQVSLGQNVTVEHEKFRWVSFEEALRLLKWENNKDAFRALNELL